MNEVILRTELYSFSGSLKNELNLEKVLEFAQDLLSDEDGRRDRREFLQRRSNTAGKAFKEGFFILEKIDFFNKIFENSLIFMGRIKIRLI